MSELQPQYTLEDFIRDVINDAPIDRASVWLRHAAKEYPGLTAEIRESFRLNETPQQVIERIARRFPAAYALMLYPKARVFIGKLQHAMKGVSI
jgi:hypothetical protein